MIFTTKIGFAAFISTGANVKLYESRIAAVVPDFLSLSYHGTTGDVVVMAGTIEEQRELTTVERDAIQTILDGDYSAETLDALRQRILAYAQTTFDRLAEEKSGIHITAMVLARWAKQEEIALAWEAEGKPFPAADNAYYWAYMEAQGDPDKTPSELMESQLANAKAWRGLQIGYTVYLQGLTATLKAATTEAELEAIRASIEPTLRGMMGLPDA